jgi:hypothetical protein
MRIMAGNLLWLSAVRYRALLAGREDPLSRLVMSLRITGMLYVSIKKETTDITLWKCGQHMNDMTSIAKQQS